MAEFAYKNNKDSENNSEATILSWQISEEETKWLVEKKS